MKSFLWLLVGVAIGFAVAHKVNETPKGREFFSNIDKRARDFGDAVSDGYRQREAEIRSAIQGD
ncbi:YtxH domain-containing protein [Leifsonia sp. fls2-241-R2A-40a]|uniref:YtxH domain-containing protein n=1 Tax=Leifsonia sp. fls2-241-R2A-40a TaxID=3040290 RepID=UPI00254A8B00|nr:YtxH domain-containing protein [Leifsonia sp. fls2-241-R2A-40a]